MMKTTMTLPAELRSAKADLARDNPFFFEDYEFSDEEYAKLRELVMIMTDVTMSESFPSHASRAQYLGVSSDKLNMWRQTRPYKKMLVEASKLAAVEGLAASLAPQILAARGGDGKAFDRLARVAGVLQDTFQHIEVNSSKHTTNTTAVFTVEAGLKDLLQQRLAEAKAKIVEAE